MAGWIDGYGYGNRVMIDHGNGYRTLYAHLSQVYVVPGQTVARGAAIGKMGSTGRSTGIHLHFEVIRNGVYLNPLSVLQ
jgi:murein DD-endopeptidase MepM/ murein hydrolase activator NlpD